MYTLFRKSQLKNALPGSLGCRTIILLLLSMCILLSAMPLEAQAVAGSYTIKWYAADPELNKAPYLPTYAKYTPTNAPSTFPLRGATGRYADPLKDAVAYDYAFTPRLDAVTSLMPKDMALGQIVPFEIEIKVTGSTTSENGVISFTGGWNTNTVSGRNFGYDPGYMVYCAFVDTQDKGTIDPLNNAKVDSITPNIVGSGSNQEIQGTIQVSGLDTGDNVIVEVWVVLKSTILSDPKPTGNIQSRLVKAQTVPTTPGIIPGIIGTGNQIISLVQIGDFFSAEADVSVIKTDSPDPVVQGQQLNYTLIVTNNDDDTVANGIVVTDKLDTNTTFVSASGAPNTNIDNTVTFNVGALSPLESKTLSIVTTVAPNAPTNIITGLSSVDGAPGPRPTTYSTMYDLCNEVSVNAITADPTPGNNVYYQPTNVLESPDYSYDLNISCEKIVLNVTPSSSDSTLLAVDWYYDTGSVLHDDVITKLDGVNYTSTYTPTHPNPVENGAWNVTFKEYSGTTLIGEFRYDFTVNQDCTGPEFPVGPVVFLVIAGVMYVTMRRKMDGS